MVHDHPLLLPTAPPIFPPAAPAAPMAAAQALLHRQHSAQADAALAEFKAKLDGKLKQIEAQLQATVAARARAHIDDRATARQAAAPDRPPVHGARRSPLDGKYYLKDPARPGKHLRVDVA